MRINKNSIFANSILYTFGNLLLKAFSFFLIPLYTAYLSTEEYGLINLSSGFYTLAASLIMLGLQYAVIRYYADFKDDKNKVAKMFGTTITFILFLGCAFVVLFCVFSDLVSQIFFKGLSFYPIVILSIGIAVTSALYTIYQDILKGMQNAKASIILSYVYFFAMLGCNMLTVIVFRLGAEGVLLSNLIVNLMMIVFMFLDLIRRKLFVFGLDFTILKALLIYSLPLIPHTLAYTLSNYATKLIISSTLSLSILGLYSLASQFGNVTDIVLNSIQSAFQPWMFGLLNEGNDKNNKEISNTSYSLMWLYGLIFICIGVFSQEAIIIMAEESYVIAWTYVPAIVLSIAIKSPLYFYTNFLYYDKSKTKYVFISTLVGSVINISLTWALVPYLQVYGSIIADIISMISRLIITIALVKVEAKKVYSLLRLEVLSLLPMLFMIVALIPAFTLFTKELSIINISIKVIVIFGFIATACIVNRNTVKSLYYRIKPKNK